MKFSTEPVKKVEAKTPEVADLLAVQESIHQSWMDLDASIKQIDEVQQIMDNIDFSINAVTKYGADAIKVLNVDGSLENLLGIPEKLITAEKAVEGLSDAAKAGWEKIKEWFRLFADKVREFVKKIHDFFIRTKVVEKTVVQTVEKEVPVEIVKEVKVYVDKIIEKKVEVPVEPPVTMEELQQVPSYTEFMKQAQLLRDMVQRYVNAMKVVQCDVSDKAMAYLVEGKTIKEMLQKWCKSDIFEFGEKTYKGMDYSKFSDLFSIGNYHSEKEYPVKSIEEWSKENYVKAWAVIENTNASDTVIVVSSLIDTVGRLATDIENVVTKTDDEDAQDMSERVQRKLTRMGQDVSDADGNYSKIVQNISSLRISCSQALKDCSLFINTRQDFVKILNKISHIFMKVDGFAKKMNDDTFWGRV